MRSVISLRLDNVHAKILSSCRVTARPSRPRQRPGPECPYGGAAGARCKCVGATGFASNHPSPVRPSVSSPTIRHAGGESNGAKGVRAVVARVPWASSIPGLGPARPGCKLIFGTCARPRKPSPAGRRLGRPRPEPDTDSKPGAPSRMGCPGTRMEPRGGLRFGWLTTEHSVESSIPQPMRLTRANPAGPVIGPGPGHPIWSSRSRTPPPLRLGLGSASSLASVISVRTPKR